MLTTTLLLATLAVGIDTGYEPTPEGGLEYIIQIPPDLLQTLKPGEAITSEMPADIQGVQRYRIQVGTGRLPRIHAPEAVQTSAQTPIPSPTAVQHQASLQSSNSKTPFEMGPTTNGISNVAPPAASYPDDRYGSRAPAPNQLGMAPLNNVATNTVPTMQTQFPVANTQLPLQLPPPPDGLDHLYNPPVATNPNPALPNQGLPNGQFVNSNQYPNNQFPANQYPNNQYPANQYGNQYPNGGMQQYPNYNQYPNNQFPNNGLPNNVANNGFPNNGFPNNGMPNSGIPNNGISNNGFVNNSQTGNPQMPGNQNGQQTADNRPAGTLASNAPAIRADDSGRVVTYREEGSLGDVAAKDRLRAAEDDAPKPWLPMYVTGLAAVGSLLGNLYLAWMWLETRRRYRQAIIERTLAV